MRRFTNVIVCTLVLLFCLAALPAVSTAQDLTVNPDGRSVTITPQAATSPSPNAVKPATALPEGTVVISSNFGSGDSYNCCEALIEAGVDQNLLPPYIDAMPFTPTKSTYRLTQLDMALTYGGVGTNAVTVELCSDDDGVPGKVLDSWSVTGLPGPGPTPTGVLTIKVTQTVLLLKNHQYWLVPIPNVNEAALWFCNNVGASGAVAYSYDDGAWNVEYGPTGAFDVLGTVLPQTPGQ